MSYLQSIGETYWSFVRKFFVRHNEGPEGLLHAALGISRKSGAISDEVYDHWNYRTQLDRDRIINDLGWMLFYITAMCNQLDTSIAECIGANVDKLVSDTLDAVMGEA